MSMKQLLSRRGMANVKDMPMLVHAHWKTLDDPFDPKTNPKGYINLGTAENHLMDSMVLDLLGRIQSQMRLKPEHIHYELFYGSKALRESIAHYWQNILLSAESQRKLEPENIVVACGCSLALEMIAIALCDPGDVILIPRPFYPGFVHDIQSRAGVIPVGVPCGTEMSKTAFETALAEQKRLGRTVRAVLFSSPNNPSGHVYSVEAIQNVLDFCMENDLDVVSDEIYSQTIYDPSVEWVSTLKVVPDHYKHRVHITGGFAKDFALSGFRVGFCHSYNPYAVKCMQELSYFSCVSSHTQALLVDLLQSPDLPELIKTSRKQLWSTYQKVTDILHRVGIKTEPAQGGIFLMADLSPFLKAPTLEAENALWQHIFKELKINISPGKLFEADKPGLFRLCFAQEDVFIEELEPRFLKLSGK